jgi:copper chaperone CopZ
MENSISTNYNIVGMTCGGCATVVKNKLSDIEGVLSVKIDLAKNEATITSNEEIEMGTLEQALLDTDYYITEITPNVKVVPSYHSAVDSARQKHNAAGDVEGDNDGMVITGPVTDYDEED